MAIRAIDNGALFALFDRFGIVAFLMFFVAPLAFPTARDRQVTRAQWYVTAPNFSAGSPRFHAAPRGQ